MTKDYAPQIATAARLITKYGGAATLKRQGAKTGDAWNPTIAADLEYAVTIVQDVNSLTRRPDTIIQKGDLFGMMKVPTGVTPTVNDKLTINGATYALEEVAPLQPDPSQGVIYYDYQARK